MRKVYEVLIGSVQYNEQATLHVLAPSIKDAATKALNIAKRGNLVGGTNVVIRVELLCTLDN